MHLCNSLIFGSCNVFKDRTFHHCIATPKPSICSQRRPCTNTYIFLFAKLHQLPLLPPYIHFHLQQKSIKSQLHQVSDFLNESTHMDYLVNCRWDGGIFEKFREFCSAEVADTNRLGQPQSTALVHGLPSFFHFKIHQRCRITITILLHPYRPMYEIQIHILQPQFPVN